MDFHVLTYLQFPRFSQLCSIHTARPHATKTVEFRRVGDGGVNWIRDDLRVSPAE